MKPRVCEECGDLLWAHEKYVCNSCRQRPDRIKLLHGVKNETYIKSSEKSYKRAN